MFGSRRFYLSLLGAVAWSTTAANTILDILDAASLSVAQESLVGLAATASGLDVVALGSVTVFSTQYAWTREGIIKNSSRGRRTLAVLCIVLSTGAMIVSLVSIIAIKQRMVLRKAPRNPSDAPIQDWDNQFTSQIIVWILACLTQAVLYSMPLWSKPKKEAQSITTSGPRDSVMSEIRHSNQTANLYMLEPTQPASPLAALPSPTFSARSSNSLKSWRESLQHVVRPVTSRTKLIKAPPSTRDGSIYSDNQSINTTTSQTDGFDSWEVDPQTRDAVLQLASASASAPSKGTALETIPGSRPASPARALDGPFPVPEDDGSDLPAPPKIVPDTSRPPSPAVSEAHIHPLFRTESPTPPPAATPGTSIVASPLASQMITCPPRPYSRMRSNSSRAGSPSPLTHSQSFYSDRSRAMSPDSLRQTPSRSPSPPSRAMTPPIPDFVLNASPRSSISREQSKRKVSLQT